MKTLAILVGMGATLAANAGTYYVLHYRVGALEDAQTATRADVRAGNIEITRLVCDVHDLKVCPGGTP